MQEMYSRINNVCLVILTGVAFTVALIYTRPIMVPFVVAVFFYAVVSPLARWIHDKWKFPRAVAVGAAIFGFLCVSAVIIYIIATSLEDFIRSADMYRDRVGQFVQWGNNLAAKWDLNLDEHAIQSKLKTMPIFTMARNLSGNVITFIGNTLLVIIFTLFLLAGEGKTNKKSKLFSKIRGQISRYLATKFLTSLITGVLVGVILTSAGVELAFMFAILTVLLNFIPSFGSIVATALPVPVILLQYGFGLRLFVVILLIGIVQFIVGNILEPKVMGETLDLHPATILLCLMFWGLVWGIPGMFLAVPITGIFKIILSRIETTKPISELLAGRLPG